VLIPHKYEVSYSKVSRNKAEEPLGFLLEELEKRAISVRQMLAEANPENNGLPENELRVIKRKVYERIFEYLVCKGIPTDSTADFKEANINDVVYTIIALVIAASSMKFGRKIRLRREKTITAIDGKYGGLEECVTVDLIGVGKTKFIFVIVAKRKTLAEAKIQCLFAMLDMGAINRGGVVYGFITTGYHGQMIRYQGGHFTQTNNFDVMFHTMRQEEKKWLEDCSIVIDAMHVALVTGGS